MKTEYRIITGAAYAYACITQGHHTLDVRLAPGKSAEAALRERETELHDEIVRLAKQASMIRAAYTECTP